MIWFPNERWWRETARDHYSQSGLEVIPFVPEQVIMTITTTELRNNQTKYLRVSSREDVFITKNGKPIAKIIGIHRKAVRDIEKLFGVLPSDIDEKAILKEKTLSLLN